LTDRVLSLKHSNRQLLPFSIQLFSFLQSSEGDMLYLKALAAAILAMGSREALAATPTAEYYFDFNSQPGTQKLRVCKHADFVDCVILGGAINTCCKWTAIDNVLTYCFPNECNYNRQCALLVE
jgi:hypothetical protein